MSVSQRLRASRTSPTRRPTVLMMGGADYTTRFVSDLSRQIGRGGRFSLSCVGLGDPAAALSDVDGEPFATQLAVPPIPGRPRTIPQFASLLALLLRGLSRNDPAWAARTSADLSRPLRQRVVRRLWVEQCREQLHTQISGFDIYHYHTLHAARLPLLFLVPPDAPVVLSVWGSDLLRSSGTVEYAEQLGLCRRASIITVSSLEIREILLSKFGRDLAGKIRLALLGLSLLDEIDRCRGSRSTFLASLGFPGDRITVCVGNNASLSNQHFAVLEQIYSLPVEHRSRLALLVPLGYGLASTEYRNVVGAALAKGDIPYHVFDTPLSDVQVAMLRGASDVMVHVPVSDAFSAAMVETLYAGGLLITGSWLPYSELRRNEISFDTVDAIDELSDRLASTIADFDERRRSAAGNQAKIYELVHPCRTVRAWTDIYDELLEPRKAFPAA